MRTASDEDEMLRTVGGALDHLLRRRTFRWYTLTSALKTEGLIHPVSLVAAGVYEAPKKSLPDQFNVFLGIYELTLNILIHRKRKYVLRILKASQGSLATCDHTRSMLTKIASSLGRSFENMTDMKVASSVVRYVVQDVVDNKRCAQQLHFTSMQSLCMTLLEQLGLHTSRQPTLYHTLLTVIRRSNGTLR